MCCHEETGRGINMNLAMYVSPLPVYVCVCVCVCWGERNVYIRSLCVYTCTCVHTCFRSYIRPLPPLQLPPEVSASPAAWHSGQTGAE